MKKRGAITPTTCLQRERTGDYCKKIKINYQSNIEARLTNSKKQVCTTFVGIAMKCWCSQYLFLYEEKAAARAVFHLREISGQLFSGTRGLKWHQGVGAR